MSQSQASQPTMRSTQPSAMSPPIPSSTGSQSVFSSASSSQMRSQPTQSQPSYGKTDQQMRQQPSQQSTFSMQDQSSFKQPTTQQTQQSSFSMQDQPSRPQPPRQPSLSDQQKPQKPPAPLVSQTSGRQSISGGAMDFGHTRPPLQTQQKAQSIFDSPASQGSKAEFSSRDSFERSTAGSTAPVPTKNTSMDFSNAPSSQSSRMNFSRDNEDIFGIGASATSSGASMTRQTTDSKTSDPWSSGPSRPVREPSLDSMGRKKEAAPQPPRQPSLTNSFENRNFDTFGGSSGSGSSMTSTNIFDPSANIFQSQSQSKPASSVSTFQSQPQGRDTSSSMKFDP